MQHSDSSSSLKALKLLGLDGSSEKQLKNLPHLKEGAQNRRFSVTSETRSEIARFSSVAGRGELDSGSGSYGQVPTSAKKSELKNLAEEHKLQIFFSDDRSGTIQAALAADLVRLFSLVITDPNLSNEGKVFVDDLIVSFGYFTTRISVLQAITESFRACLKSDDGASKATRVFWALRKFIILERKGIRGCSDCFKEVETFRQELSTGSEQLKSFATFLEKYLNEEDTPATAEQTTRDNKKARRKSEPPKMEPPPPTVLPSKASQLLGLSNQSSSSPAAPATNTAEPNAQSKRSGSGSKASLFLGSNANGSTATNAFESASAPRPNSIAAMLDEKDGPQPQGKPKSRSGSAESNFSDTGSGGGFDTSYNINILLTSDSEDIAEQLMAIDFDLFRKTQIHEYCNSAFAREAWKTNAVAALIEQANRFSRWIGTTVLNPKIDKTTRAKLISKLIKLMESLKSRNDFFSMVTVFTTLESNAISRLKRTWKLVKRGKRDQLKRYAEMLKPMSNFAGYRDLLGSAELPCVPYIGMTTKDLVMLEEMATFIDFPSAPTSARGIKGGGEDDSEATESSESVRPPPAGEETQAPTAAEKAVNWPKMQMIARVLNNQIAKFRTGTFVPAQRKPEIFNDLNFLVDDGARLISFEDFSKFSDEIEPRVAESSTQAPGSPISGEPLISLIAKRKKDAINRRTSSGSLSASFQTSIDSDDDCSSDESIESVSSAGSQRSLRNRISARKMLDQSSRTSKPTVSEDSNDLQMNRHVARQLTNTLFYITNSSVVHNRMKSHPFFFQYRPSSLCLTALHAVMNMELSTGKSPRTSPLNIINLPALFATVASLILEDGAVCPISDLANSAPSSRVGSLGSDGPIGSPSIRHAASESLLRTNSLRSGSGSQFAPVGNTRSIQIEKKSLLLVEAGSHSLVGDEQMLLIILSYFSMACRSIFQASNASVIPIVSSKNNIFIYVRDDDDGESYASEDESSLGDDHLAPSSGVNKVARVKISMSELPLFVSSTGNKRRLTDSSPDDLETEDDFGLDELLASAPEIKATSVSVPPIAASIMKHVERFLSSSVNMRVSCQRLPPPDRDTDASRSSLVLNLHFNAGWWAPVTSATNIAQPSSFSVVSLSPSSSGSSSRSGSNSKRSSSRRERDKDRDREKDDSKREKLKRSHKERRGSLNLLPTIPSLTTVTNSSIAPAEGPLSPLSPSSASNLSTSSQSLTLDASNSSISDVTPRTSSGSLDISTPRQLN